MMVWWQKRVASRVNKIMFCLTETNKFIAVFQLRERIAGCQAKIWETVDKFKLEAELWFGIVLHAVGVVTPSAWELGSWASLIWLASGEERGISER
jgi:hypothetical protein